MTPEEQIAKANQERQEALQRINELQASLATTTQGRQDLEKQLTELRTELSGLNTKITGLMQENETLKKATKPDGTVDVAVVIAGAAEEVKRKYEPIIAELTASVETERKARAASEFAALKQGRIANAAQSHGVSAQLLTAMVATATDVSSLEAAISSSVAIIKANLPSTPAGGNANQPTGGAGAAGGTVIPNPPVVGSQTKTQLDQDTELLTAARTMTPPEYAKNRAAIVAAQRRIAALNQSSGSMVTA